MQALKKLWLTFVVFAWLVPAPVWAQGPDPAKLYAQAWQSYEQAMQQGNHQAAVAALKKLSQFGDSKALFYLGTHYSLGQGVDKDLAKSFSYFQQAAAAGEVEAKFMLGIAYWQGNGVEKSPRRAHEIFRELADNNHAGAQYHLALLYGQGVGVAKDLAKAREWLAKAAANGDPAAINHLQRKTAQKY